MATTVCIPSGMLPGLAPAGKSAVECTNHVNKCNMLLNKKIWGLKQENMECLKQMEEHNGLFSIFIIDITQFSINGRSHFVGSNVLVSTGTISILFLRMKTWPDLVKLAIEPLLAAMASG